MTDEILIAGLKKGNPKAQEQLYHDAYRRTFAVCYKLLKDWQEAEDATSLCLFRTMRNIKKFKGDCALSSWMYRIATNECLMMLRKRKRIPTPQAEPVCNRVTVLEDDPMLRRTIIKAFNNLCPNHKEVLMACLTQEPNLIPSNLNLSLAAYKSRKHRGRLELKENIRKAA